MNWVQSFSRPGHILVLVTADGRAFRFTGKSIAGVGTASVRHYEFLGKQVSDYSIVHDETTEGVIWKAPVGKAFPQGTWEEGFRFLAEKAPALTRQGFEKLIRTHWPSRARYWDMAAGGKGVRSRRDSLRNSTQPGDAER